jgi:hypothetical protein
MAITLSIEMQYGDSCSRVGITAVVPVLNRYHNASRVTPTGFTLAYAYVEADSRIVQLLSCGSKTPACGTSGPAPGQIPCG